MRWNFREYRFRLSTRVSSPGECAHRECANSRGHSSQETAGAYRQGNTGRLSRQGESLAMAADPLVLRSSSGRQASDAQSGQEHAGSGRSDLEYSGVQIQGHRYTATARLSAATAPACLYPEGQWEAETVGNSTMKDRSMQALYLLA